jgi:hypothetical protein
MNSVLRLCLVTILALSSWLGGAAPSFGQDPVEFSKLSSDQRQLAEQVRRLEKILSVLETRERKEGQESRAELLKQARLRLSNVSADRPLSSVLEEVAADLGELRAGTALSQQAELVRFLEDLLDFLLETKRREQVQDLLQAALQREQALRELSEQQNELRERTEALEQAEADSGQCDQQSRDELAAAQNALNQKIRELAEQEKNSSSADSTSEAADEGEQAEQALGSEAEMDSASQEETGDQASEQPNGEIGDEASDEAGEQPSEQPNGQAEDPAGGQPEENPGEQAESGDPAKSAESGQSKPSDSSPQSKPSSSKSPQQSKKAPLDQAQEHQKKAQEKLDEAADQAKAEADRLENMDELETLINVLEKAEELAERHQRVERQLIELVASMDGATRVPRSARVKLRQWANEQKVLSEETDALMFEVREAGADSYPFLLRLLLEDHATLANRLGPPKYKANPRAVSLSERISKDWEHLILAIRLEMDRLRRKLEQPPGGEGEGEEEPESEPEPLVGMAAEVQLLKLLQGDLRDEILGLLEFQRKMASAGIEMDADDLADLDFLVQRQQQLRSLFESILERLNEAQGEKPAGNEEI